nr:hypothetical protein [Tanacetum cinerariifolium]
RVENLEQDKIAQALEITKLKQRVKRLEKRNKVKVSGGCIQTGGIIAEMDADEDVTLEEVELEKDAEVAEDADLMTEVVTATATTITIAPITAAPSAARRRKGVVIRDPKETATLSIIVHSEPKSKDKGKGILGDVIEQVKRKEKQDNAVFKYQELKRKPQTEAHVRKNMMVYLKNMAGFKMDFFKEKGKEHLEEEASKALKRKSESSEQQAAKKQKLNDEVEELKKHLQIIPNDEDDVYTEATPLALKIVQERFASSKPKNFSDDFLLNALKTMFEKPDVEAQVWKNQRGSYGLSKVKSWKLLESCRVHIITCTTTQMILLVERRYPLTRFTLEQMLNNVRLEVKEESEVLLELLRFVRRQQQEGYRPDFEVDATEDFKEYTLRNYYCWLKTYCCWYKLKLLDNAADSRLRLLEESAAADEKMKK